MSYSKPIAVVLASVVCATVFAADAGAQSRDRSRRRGPTVGRAAPRGNPSRAERPRSNSPRVIAPRSYGRSYRPSYNPYRPGRSLGFYSGYRYGYPYSYGYPYAFGSPYGSYAYGSSYGYPYGYRNGPYGGYGYAGPSYGYADQGYGYAGDVYGGVRIQDAPRDAQVFADGYYAGIVDDFDGAFQRLSLEAGAHEIEIRAPGFPPMTFDVNVQPGRTLNLHVR